MSTTSLTDRYVWTVSRQLSAQAGPDVARELRGTLAEMIEGRMAAGESPEQAERAAIAELGDPDVLAREYGGKPQHLIGPAIYADYVRLIRVLLVVTLPILVAVMVVIEALAPEPDLAGLIGRTVGGVIETTVHLVFWTTLVFVLIEHLRSESERDAPLSTWDPDQLLTADVPWRRPGFGEMVTEVCFGAILALLVAWQLTGVGEQGVQVLDPGLGVVWKVAIIGFFVLDAVVAFTAWRVGRWTPGLTTVNVLSNVAAAVVLVGLLYADRLLTDLPTVLGDQFGLDTDWSVSYPLVAAGIVLVCGWDAVNSIVQAWRARRGAALADQ